MLWLKSRVKGTDRRLGCNCNGGDRKLWPILYMLLQYTHTHVSVVADAVFPGESVASAAAIVAA